MHLNVEIEDKNYLIYIGSSYLTDKDLFRNILGNKKVAVVTNSSIASLYLKKLQDTLERPLECIVILEDGEKYKTLQTVEVIFNKMLEAKLNRSSLLIALGGGVIGDMTGFAAACYQRGIDFIQIPTTLLAQVDSSVGGKTGVNHPLGKNMIGVFHQPKVVIIDTDTLKTLPDRELSAGLAEVIKYGLIADESFFIWLEKNMGLLIQRNTDSLTYVIHKSCETKATIVAADEKETGVRATLNLGHTFGHAIETNAGYGNWLHGEAVAVGMVMAVDLSCRMGWLPASILERTKNILVEANLPIKAPSAMTVESFIEVMSIDKKNLNGSIRLVLLTSLGNACVTENYDRNLMEAVIRDNIAE